MKNFLADLVPEDFDDDMKNFIANRVPENFDDDDGFVFHEWLIDVAAIPLLTVSFLSVVLAIALGAIYVVLVLASLIFDML